MISFAYTYVLVGVDEERDPCRQPTKDNIRLAMRWLVEGCTSGDSLVFHFSGHGVQKLDNNGDEVLGIGDGRDKEEGGFVLGAGHASSSYGGSSSIGSSSSGGYDQPPRRRACLEGGGGSSRRRAQVKREEGFV